MSWPSSNFHHDSFEYINPSRPEYRPVDVRINHNTNITFKGPSSSSVKTAGWLNLAGGVFNGLANLGAAWMLSKGNTTGAQMFSAGGSIFNNAFGGSFGGGYNSYGIGNSGYLLDQTWYNPIAFSGGGTPIQSSPSNQSAQSNQSNQSNQSAQSNQSNQSNQSAQSNQSNQGAISPTAEQFNNAIDDIWDTNEDGKIDENDKIFAADVYNDSRNLAHTTSETGNKTGVKRGIAKGAYPAGENAETKTDSGFYKYITVTDKDSGNEWTFTFKEVKDGKPVYTFNKDYSDLSKDDKGSGKGWEVTGQQPDYEVTVDPSTGQIKMISHGNNYAATKMSGSSIA